MPAWKYGVKKSGLVKALTLWGPRYADPPVYHPLLHHWQLVLKDIWNTANNKLHAIYPTVGKIVHNNLVSHRDAVNRKQVEHWPPMLDTSLPTFLERTNQHVQHVTLY